MGKGRASKLREISHASAGRDHERGHQPPILTPALTEAVNLVDRARQQGTPLADLVRQRDVFSGAISPETEAMLRLMFRDDNFKRPASRQAVAAALRYYADQARKATTDKILDLGDAAASPLDILKLAANRGSGDLLGAAAAESRVPTEAAQAAPTGRVPSTAELRALAQRAASRSATARPETLTLARDEQATAAADTLPTEGVANMTPGANYTGSVRDKYDPAVAVTKDPVRREKILADFVKAIGMPLYQGRVRGKSEGFYRPHVGEVRIKRSNDLETAIHEWAHLIDDKFPEIRKQWTPASATNKAVRDELRGVSYDKTKLFEGFAEAVRLWATQPQEAAAKAPLFNGWFNDFVTRNPHGPAFVRFRDRATAWFEQAAVDRARSKIGGDQAINAGITRIWDKFRQGTVDDLHGIKHMEETLTGTLSPVGAYETARLTRAKASIVEGMLKLGRIQVKPDGSHEFVGKGLKQILEPVADRLDDFLMYAVGRSANELMGHVRGEVISFVAGLTNTGPATLNVSGNGTIAIQLGGAALRGMEICAGLTYTVMLDTTSTCQLIGGVLPFTANSLINGGLEVWERGTSIAVAASTTAYTVDRWYITTGANQAHTISQQTGLTNGSRFCARVQRNSGQTGTGAIVKGQPYTTDMLVPLRGSKITISGWLASGANWSPTSGNLTISFYQGTGTEGKRGGGFTSETTVVTTTVALTAGSSATFFSATSAAVLPTTATQGELQFTWTPVGTASTNDWFSIDDVKVEPNVGPTPFDRPQFTDELERCQRFAWVQDFATGAASGLFAGFCDTTTTALLAGAPPVKTRTPFTGVTVSNATNFNVRSASGATPGCTTLAFQAAWNTGLALVATVASGLTAGQGAILRPNNVNCKIEWTGAEL